MNDLIAQAASARREARHAEAHELLLQALALAREAQPGRDLVLALKGLGQLQRDLGRLEASRQSYADAVAICRGLHDPLLLAHTLRHLGDLYRETHSLALAQRLCSEALEIYRQHTEAQPLDLANAIRSLALLSGDRGSSAAARSLWEEAMHLYAAVGVPEGVAECASHLLLIPGDPA